MKRRILAALMGIALSSCIGREGADDTGRTVEFEGQLIELDGRPTPASTVGLTLFHYPSGSRPNNYYISNRCFDAGHFDENQKRYVSRFAPEKPDSGPLPRPHNRFCDPDDVSRQRQMREWMFSGATISIRADDGHAVVTSRSGATAIFADRGPDLA